jgi:hypothetical protein
VNVNAPSGNYVGGLVGGISSADIEISKTYSIGETTGQDYVGGLIGGTLYDSLSPIISDSHAQVNVVGRRYVGGFIGYFYDSYISNSYASSVVSGNEPDRSGAFAGSANSISGSFLTRVSASGSAPVENDEEATRDALFGERSGLIQYTGPIEYYQGTIDSTDLFASLGLNWSLNPAINDALPYITSLECSYRECDSDSPPSNGIAYTNRIILSKEREVAISDAKNFIAYNHEISKDCCFSIIDSRTTNVSNLTSTYISENQIATGIPLDLYLNMGEKLQVKVETDPRVYLNLWMESDYCEPVYLGEVPANNLLSTEKQIVILPPFEFSKSGRYTLSLYKSKIDNTVKVDNMNLYTQIHILVQ